MRSFEALNITKLVFGQRAVANTLPGSSQMGSGKLPLNILLHQRLWRLNLGGYGISVVSLLHKFLAMPMCVIIKLFPFRFVPLLAPNPATPLLLNLPEANTLHYRPR